MSTVTAIERIRSCPRLEVLALEGPFIKEVCLHRAAAKLAAIQGSLRLHLRIRSH
jgi:hypothetical protein